MDSTYYRSAINYVCSINGTVKIKPSLGRPSQGSSIATDGWAQQFAATDTGVVKLVRISDNATRIFTTDCFKRWCELHNIHININKCLVVPPHVKFEKYHFNLSLEFNGQQFNVGFMPRY